MESRTSPVKATCARSSGWWLAIVVGSLLSVIFLWLTAIPLGIPGEWVWSRPSLESDWTWNLVGGAIAAGLFTAFVVIGWHRLDSHTDRHPAALEIAGWLIGLVALSFGWLWIVQEVAPSKNRLGKSAFVLYFPSSSGYFTRARYETRRSDELLAGYEALMREGDVLHTGTHPPGLFLVFHALIEISESSSLISSLLDWTQTDSFRESCDIIEGNALRSGKPRVFLPQDRRVLWLATLLVMFCAALTVVPLFGLLWRHVPLESAWVCAALWPAIPAVAIFIPKSDVLFSFFGLMIMWIWFTAWDRRSVSLAFVAGAIAWCGLVCSLAFLPVFLLTALLSLGLPVSESEPAIISTRRIEAKRIGCLLGGLVGFATPTIALWQTAHVNLLNVWWLNYQNHAGFYRQFTRTYWKWLLVNPIELCLAVGAPVALLALAASTGVLVRSIRERRRTIRPGHLVLVLAIAIVWGALWLTGKNSGEAARLWVLMMPWLVWLASLEVNEVLATAESVVTRRRQVVALLAFQLAICLLTVLRVSGFHGDSP